MNLEGMYPYQGGLELETGRIPELLAFSLPPLKSAYHPMKQCHPNWEGYRPLS